MPLKVGDIISTTTTYSSSNSYTIISINKNGYTATLDRDCSADFLPNIQTSIYYIPYKKPFYSSAEQGLQHFNLNYLIQGFKFTFAAGVLPSQGTITIKADNGTNTDFSQFINKTISDSLTDSVLSSSTNLLKIDGLVGVPVTQAIFNVTLISGFLTDIVTFIPFYNRVPISIVEGSTSQLLINSKDVIPNGSIISSSPTSVGDANRTVTVVSLGYLNGYYIIDVGDNTQWREINGITNSNIYLVSNAISFQQVIENKVYDMKPDTTYLSGTKVVNSLNLLINVNLLKGDLRLNIITLFLKRIKPFFVNMFLDITYSNNESETIQITTGSEI